jgi:hypothetical protein
MAPVQLRRTTLLLARNCFDGEPLLRRFAG